MVQTKELSLRDNVLQSMMKYANILQQLGMKEQAETMQAKIVEYTQGMFQVMFTGEFSTGKSTTLNALTRRQLLKTSIVPETAVLAKIINGKNSDMVTVTFRDTNRPDSVMPYEKFKKEFRLDEKDSEKFHEVAYVTITNEMRNPTVIFVDSPGLGHTNEDNQVSNNFADKADAIVMMLTAAKLGQQSEREYIQRRFAGRGLRNVFFVVNYWNYVQTLEQAQELEANLKHLIGCAFTDADGHFDEALYNQRVFRIDAYTSECARTGKPKSGKQGMRFVEIPVAPEEDKDTGVIEFEKALTEFLDSPDKEKAAFVGYLPQVARHYAAAKNRVDTAVKNAQMSLAQLRKEQADKEAEIKKLEKLIDDIQHSYDNAMNSIMTNIEHGYDSFARSVENNWDSYFNSIHIPFGIKEAGKLGFMKTKYAVGGFFGGDQGADDMAQDPEFKALTAPIGEAIEKYLEVESEKMKDMIMADSQAAVNRLEKDLTHYMTQLEDIDLTGIDLSVFGIQPNVADGELAKKANLVQVILSILMGGNWDQAFRGIAGGGQSWGSFIKDFIVTEIVEALILSIIDVILGPVAWLYVIARASWAFWRGTQDANNMGRKIVLNTKEEVVDCMKNERDSQLFAIQQKFSEKLKKNGDAVSKGFKASLRQEKELLAKMIEEKEKNDAAAKQEAARLADLKEKLMNEFNTLADLIQGRSYTEDGILSCSTEKV